VDRKKRFSAVLSAGVAAFVGLSCCCLRGASGAGESGKRTGAQERRFYLPENPEYTIVDSMVDSLRFTAEKTLRPCGKGFLASISSFVDPRGRIMGWHDFGYLEGPGWAANAVGGAYELHQAAVLLGKEAWRKKALAVLDHVLNHGFIDKKTGFIRPYRITPEGLQAMGKPKNEDLFCLNYKKNNDWYCPGSIAKIAFQLLQFADALRGDKRAARMEKAAYRCALYLRDHVPEVPNGWFPRRVTPRGEIYRKTPEGGNEPFWQNSADGLFMLQLWAVLQLKGKGDWKKLLRLRTDAFIKAGGIFGSINHDTYDPHENVAYAVAFRTLRLVSKALEDPSIRAFAYKRCLSGLDKFKMCEDRNGVATRGLLYMEKTWPTAYLWENAEAALAYFEAASEQPAGSAERRAYELNGLTILRACAKHHHGPYGFLTEGVDWSNHVGRQHHIGKALYGDIKYTEPFLNNQHITEPTLFYLEHLARIEKGAGITIRRDCEGNVLLRLADK